MTSRTKHVDAELVVARLEPATGHDPPNPNHVEAGVGHLSAKNSQPAMTSRTQNHVMAGLDPAIHAVKVPRTTPERPGSDATAPEKLPRRKGKGSALNPLGPRASDPDSLGKKPSTGSEAPQTNEYTGSPPSKNPPRKPKHTTPTQQSRVDNPTPPIRTSAHVQAPPPPPHRRPAGPPRPVRLRRPPTSPPPTRPSLPQPTMQRRLLPMRAASGGTDRLALCLSSAGSTECGRNQVTHSQDECL